MWFKHACGPSWSEIARRLGTYHYNVWLWKEGRARPNAEHMMALIDLAKGLGLDRLFKD